MRALFCLMFLLELKTPALESVKDRTKNKGWVHGGYVEQVYSRGVAKNFSFKSIYIKQRGRGRGRKKRPMMDYYRSRETFGDQIDRHFLDFTACSGKKTNKNTDIRSGSRSGRRKAELFRIYLRLALKRQEKRSGFGSCSGLRQGWITDSRAIHLR